MFEFLINTDKELFLLINGIHNPTFDYIMWWISKPITWIPLYILIAYLIVKKHGQIGFIYILLAGLLIAMSDLASVHLFKNIFQRLRPSHNMDLQDIIHQTCLQ